MSEQVQYLRPKQAAAKLAISVSALWSRVKSDEDFPRPTKLGPRTTIFSAAELDQYVQRRAVASRQS
ncbi:helix-turn-helix transcriptional regulator [Burkholderia pseudomallei]|uniref:helix-turn-helix transcriptional regulator n=1 Tax=Burkholderia pseudomallei TaxID=28450 RepID=UPI000F07372D|nr:AlpA family phage regulatory protein [Burkholderia pseudomallei]CAJ3281657.1 prophage CP4-57 regulatory protein (AlpA) [Burkholderia pseudomallei]CAJ6140059.1 prophage CP4-57 regulatory protein (AlpA) [Burkholderia pseudomallei]VBF47546.1 prophage CP4-57 regulatory protein (AlpA) [Burkholderia pseudomallei]VBQ48179.1 prophage CP4-57 regulatory protein (AlpA) [Burkholderia pseudomallei]VCE77922.1 prophage CP4-57 regulatory protein (AlpA) [Burkholderia pseudomallei]